MTNQYAWLPERDSLTFVTPITEVSATDIASVGELWVTRAYDDLRRAGPDRATQVRWILSRYVNPWFEPQTSTIGEVTYFMVHAWLMRLAGRPLADTDPCGSDRGGVVNPVGLSQSVIADALWTLRGVLGFARATGIVPPGFDPTEVWSRLPRIRRTPATSRLPVRRGRYRWGSAHGSHRTCIRSTNCPFGCSG